VHVDGSSCDFLKADVAPSTISTERRHSHQDFGTSLGDPSIKSRHGGQHPVQILGVHADILVVFGVVWITNVFTKLR
jgi:hypothetical protein